MMKKNLLSLALPALCVFSATGQTGNKISNKFNPGDLQALVSFLSSDRMEGREAGTRGSMLASDFIALMMQMNRLEPAGDLLPANKNGDQRSWFRNFCIIRCHDVRKAKDAVENSDKADNEYIDDEYYLEGDTIPSPNDFKIDTLHERNVEGIIRGKDSTRSIIIGAHYDHLGIRNGNIYNGADDNGSGVAGLIALAREWAMKGEKPPCNIIFAAWAAEEKGQLGSKFFAEKTRVKPGKVIITLNMDMISRSAPGDSAGRQLSIGTRTVNDDLRKMANEINNRLSRPFELDLWDVTGHTGSDYRYFSEAGIPVMTFFSGYDVDYHTPEDEASRIDIRKMCDILDIVDQCISVIVADISSESVHPE